MSPENQWLEDVFSIEIGHFFKYLFLLKKIMYIEKKVWGMWGVLIFGPVETVTS